MATIVTRTDKASTLTTSEMDGNFNNLNSDKLEAQNGTATGTLTAEDISANNLVNTGVVNIDTALGDTVICKIAGNTTFTASGLAAGSVNTLYLVVEATGAGSITWPGVTTFNSGAEIQTDATGKTMIILDTVDDGVTFMGVQAWRDFA